MMMMMMMIIIIIIIIIIIMWEYIMRSFVIFILHFLFTSVIKETRMITGEY